MRLRVEVPIVVLDPETSAPVASAQVTFVDRETGGAADVWTTETGGSLRTQPILTDSVGRLSGWVQRGSYTAVVTIPGRPPYTDFYDASPASAGAVDSDWIASDAITSAKIASNAVGNSELANDAVDTAEVKDAAITGAKLKSSASVDGDRPVGTDNIKDNAITSAKIAVGAIGATDLALNVVPLGTVIDWWRATTGTSVPSGWAVCDGTAWSQIANDFSLGSGNIPNLVGKVTMGARLTTTLGGATAADGAASSVGDAYANSPGIGGIGGSNASKNFYHSHYTEHTHTYYHTHNVPDHLHGINPQALSANGIGTITGNGYGYINNAVQSAVQSYSSGTARLRAAINDTVYIPDVYIYNHGHGIDSHSHGGATTGADRSLRTNDMIPANGTSTQYLTSAMQERDYTDGPSWSSTPAYDGSTSSALVDLRPAHVGLLKIMKVKNV